MYDKFKKPELQGSVILRHVSPPSKLPKGKKMMVVFGVVIVNDDFAIATDQQVRVMAQDTGNAEVTMLMQTTGTDRTRYAAWQVGMYSTSLFGEHD